MGISTALAVGHTVKNILSYLYKANPIFANQINKAISQGYSPSEIVTFLEELEKKLTIH